MADTKNNNSFSHAFLPGLILGLIIGAVAGAFLPDLLSGPKLPTLSGQPTGTHKNGARDRDGMMEEDTEKLIEEAEQKAKDAAGDVELAIDGDEPTNLPTPPSDG